jgi:glycosyltransferase involved in cell wall biosynthesis
MSKDPVISVAMAARNYGQYLPRALESIFRCHNPTAAPLQVVVADDASTDDTRAVLADYRLRYPRSLDVVSLRVRSGVGAAKQAALDRCAGRFIALLDADDEFLPHKFVHGYPILERGDVDIVTNDFYHRTEAGESILENRRNWPQWYWPPSTWMFRRGVVRFNPHALAADELEWIERRWPSLRHVHIDRPLNLQYLHAQNSHLRPQSRIPAYQVIGRLTRDPMPDDRLAPPAWACRECGNYYLVPTDCCGRKIVSFPLLFYWAALSPHCRAAVEFSLVMLTRNRRPLTRRAVTSLLERIPTVDQHRFELIFVDGTSTDGTLDDIRKLAATFPVKLILTHPKEPFNYSRACNLGALAARGKYLLFLNNDIELRSDPPWDSLRAALEDPRVGAAGASTVWSPTHHDPPRSRASSSYLVVDRPLTGDFWGTRREVFWELGGMDESFTGYGYDELEFQFRAQLAQYVLALSQAQIYHELHGTYDAVYGAAAREQMAQANRRQFERKHRCGIYLSGARMEPHVSHCLPRLSVVIAARNEAPLIRRTLALAAQDPGCHAGLVQVVVVDNGSTDDTGRALEEYRLRLPYTLTAITLTEPEAPARALQIGRARAVGRIVTILPAGEWLETLPMPTEPSGPSRNRRPGWPGSDSYTAA